jgi:hypothetical protein
MDDKVLISTLKTQTELPVFVCELAAIQVHLDLARQALDELRLAHPETTPSNVHAAYMSPWKSHHLNAKLLPLCESAVTIAHSCSQMINAVALPSLNMELMVSDCWGAIYEQSDFAARHNHFPADFSVVIYLEADANCAPIIFSGDRVFQPQAGKMVVFPGILDHEVPASDGRRVVIAMNLLKKSTFVSAASI